MSESRNQDPTLATSLAWCKQMCKASGSSFYPAFRLLDRPRRNAMYALYAFARITDDLGDSDSPVEARRDSLVSWRQLALDRLGGSDIANCPTGLEAYVDLWPALRDSASKFAMPLEHFDELVQGVMLDLDHQPLATWKENKRYCYHVATTVGLLCTYIWRKDTAVTPDLVLADQCGLAFQLTNILRDVAEDASNGRIYVPADELERFGISQASWLAGQPDGDWKALVDSVALKANEAYEAGLRVEESLTPRSRQMFKLMWRSYRKLLENVVSQKDKLWTDERIRLSKTQKASLIANAVLK